MKDLKRFEIKSSSKKLDELIRDKKRIESRFYSDRFIKIYDLRIINKKIEDERKKIENAPKYATSLNDKKWKNLGNGIYTTR